MSRMSKAMYVLGMVDNNIVKGDDIPKFRNCTVVRGKAKKNAFYYYCFKPLYDCFCRSEIKDWAYNHYITDDADIELKDTRGETLYFYEL